MIQRIRTRSTSLCLPVATYMRLLVWNDKASPRTRLADALTRITQSKHVQTPYPYQLPANLRAWAAERAEKLSLDQSAYLVALIQLDLEEGGPLVVAEVI
jgi:hypothetical protein